MGIKGIVGLCSKKIGRDTKSNYVKMIFTFDAKELNFDWNYNIIFIKLFYYLKWNEEIIRVIIQFH